MHERYLFFRLIILKHLCYQLLLLAIAVDIFGSTWKLFPDLPLTVLNVKIKWVHTMFEFLANMLSIAAVLMWTY